MGVFFPLYGFSETVFFSGHVSQNTCNITINEDTRSAIVVLPAAQVSKLSALGKTAGDTRFSIGMKGCDAKGGGAAEKYIAEIIASNANISNLAGTASNIELQLLVADRHFNKASPFRHVYSSGLHLDPAGRTSIPLIVRYYAATDNVVSGSIVTSTAFLVVYN